MRVAAAPPRGTLRWVSWTTPARDGSFAGDAHLALFRREAAGARLEWSAMRPQAYEPRLDIVQSWRYRDHPVVLWRYQMGAAEQELEVVVLDERDRPHLLDHVAAQSFELRFAERWIAIGWVFPDPARCWTFAAERRKLIAVGCPPW